MRKLYFVISIDKNGKHYAYVDEVYENYNLCGLFEGRHEFDGRTLQVVMHVPTKKKAHELAEAWNETYKNNGTLIDWRTE